MQLFNRRISVYIIGMKSELADAKMGKYHQKFQRCSSVPNGSTKGLCEIDFKLRKNLNIDDYDILFSKTVKDLVSIEIRSRLIKNWKTDKNGLYKSSIDDTTSNLEDDHTSNEDMPSRKLSINRRAARADIFCDMDKDEVRRLLNYNMCSECSDIKTNQDVGRRRCGLGDIFEGVQVEEIDRLYHCDASEHYTCARRSALHNIFEGISETDVSRVTHCEDEECSDECPSNCRRGRRFGMGDIFSENKPDMVCSDTSSDDCEELPCGNCPSLNTRRCALADIFNGVTEEDLHRIMAEIDPVSGVHDFNEFTSENDV